MIVMDDTSQYQHWGLGWLCCAKLAIAILLPQDHLSALENQGVYGIAECGGVQPDSF